jgi:hypothetical protein
VAPAPGVGYHVLLRRTRVNYDADVQTNQCSAFVLPVRLVFGLVATLLNYQSESTSIHETGTRSACLLRNERVSDG